MPAHDKLLLLAFSARFITQGIEPFTVESLAVGEEPLDRTIVYRSLGHLLQNGLVISLQVRSDKTTDKKYLLSSKAVSALFKGQRHLVQFGNLTRQADLLLAADIPQKELYFGELDGEQILTMASLLHPEKYRQYINLLSQKGISGTAGILLMGPPGTGKTEIVRQIARFFGYDMLVADISKLEGEWWGESEKNYRELFRSCNYLAAVSEVPPILFFNEADAILSSRVAVRTNADKLSNTIQNILLDELEKFTGIFIATTNLSSNLDQAFERRFSIKILLSYPEPEVSAKIWTAKISELTLEQALHLARQFRFSGGQIDNICRRCILYQIIHEEFPSLKTIEEFCRHEQLDRNDRVRVQGFSPRKG